MRYLLLVMVFFVKLPLLEAEEASPFQVIIDDEVESALGDWVNQIAKVAKLNKKINIVLIQSQDCNAAATPDGSILVFTGLIEQCSNVSELLGVLAHETAHLKKSHYVRFSSSIDMAQTPAMISLFLGGLASLVVMNPAPLFLGAAGGAHVAERTLLKNSRVYESEADQLAICYLKNLHWPLDGFAQFLKKLHNEYSEPLTPYALTHPLTKERYQRVLKEACVIHETIPKDMEDRFQRIKLKLWAFLTLPSQSLKILSSQKQTLAVSYARCIALYKNRDLKESMSLIEQLLKKNPKDPYLWELKGQILFETGHIKESICFFDQAVQYKKKSTTLKLLKTQALVELFKDVRENKELNQALSDLHVIVQNEPNNIMAWHLLSVIYGRRGNTPCAHACLAERAYLLNQTTEMESRLKNASTCQVKSLRQRVQDLNHTLKKSKK